MNPKIIDYVTVCADDAFNIDKFVNARISRGWQPFGGVATGVETSADGAARQLFVQAMVMYEESLATPSQTADDRRIEPNL